MENGCHVTPVQRTISPETRAVEELALLAVWGMGCPNCAMRVHNSLVMLDGVIDAYVEHVAGTARVKFNPNMVDVPALIEAVARAGNDGRHEYRAMPLHRQRLESRPTPKNG